MAASPQPKDNIYALKVCKLLIDQGGIVYRCSLVKKAEQAVGKIPALPQNLDEQAVGKIPALPQYLDNNKSIIKSLKPKCINPDQYNKIFPNNKAVENADTFDISLLAVLFRNTCSCSPIRTNGTCSCQNEVMWNAKQIPVTDTSEIADLVRIRNFRNEIQHIPNTAAYDEPMFESKWAEIAKVIVRRCPDLEPEINVLKSAPFDKDLQSEFENLEQKLKEWKTLEEITSKIEVHDAEIKETQHAVNLHDQRIKELEASKANELDTCIEYSEKHKCMLQRDLIYYYKDTCSRLQISPLIDGQGWAPFNEFYISPTLYLVDLTGKKVSPIKSYSDVFVKKSNICQHIYISSKAGCGKSSLVKHMALCWCQAHQSEKANTKWLSGDIKGIKPFEFLFLLFLRDSYKSECSIDIMIQNQLLPKLPNPLSRKIGLEFIQQLLCTKKCLIVLDGLDEWSHPQNSQCKEKNKQIPHSRAWPHCTILTTTRPWKLDVAALKAEEIDKKLKLGGLEEDLLKKLIERVIKKINELYKKNKRAKDFIAELKDKKLTHLSKIPVVAMQLLTLWYDGEPIGRSQCEIYHNMVGFLFKLFNKKNKLEGCQLQDPVFFQDIQHCSDPLDLFSRLGKLAFHTLFGDNVESSLEFDKTIVEEHVSDEDVNISLKVGILTSESKCVSITKEPASNFKFIHKTFQEFLAAFYITRSAENLTAVREKMENFCCSIEKILEMSQIFMFMGGLCPEVLPYITDHLRNTVAADNRIKNYRSSCTLQMLSSEGKILRKVQNTALDCLQESWLNGHKNVVLPVSDFFIHDDKYMGLVWSDKLKHMVVNNPVSSLYVHGINDEEELKDIANAVNELNNIQKLYLDTVPGTFVISLFCPQKDSLNLKENWRHLKCITLWDVDMSKDNLFAFIDYITQLPNTVSVHLMIFDISPPNYDWVKYIKEHRRLTVINAEDGVSFNTNLSSVDVDQQ